MALSREVRRPLYEIEGLISFYPHFRTDPPKKVELRVCHDLSCWLRGSDERIARLRERYGQDAEVELVEGSCLGRCDIAPACTVNEAPVPMDDAAAAVTAAASRAAEPQRPRERSPRGQAVAAPQPHRPAVSWPNDPYRGRRRPVRRAPVRARRAARHRGHHRGTQGRRAARHGRRGLPRRAQVGPGRGAGGHAEVRDLQRRRVRARHVQGQGDPGHPAVPGPGGPAARHARGRRRRGLGVHPPRIRPRGAGDPPGDRVAARDRVGGPGCGRLRQAAVRRGVHLAGRLHPRRGVRADRVHGRAPRRAAEQAAVPRHLRPARPADADELGGDARPHPDHRDPRRRLVDRAGHGTTTVA